MKKYISAVISAAILTAVMPQQIMFASNGAEELITNGSFEIVDKYDFPTQWNSNGKNLLANGDFESGSRVFGKELSGTKTLSYEGQGGVPKDNVTVLKNDDADVAKYGKYNLSMNWTSSQWGGAGVRNDDFGVAKLSYGRDYIFRASVKAGSAGDFTASKKHYFQINVIANYNNKDNVLSNNSWSPTTEWQEFAYTYSVPEKVEGYPDELFAKRLQWRVGGANSATAVLHIDNLTFEKLGRTTAEQAFDGNRSLKYIGYDDNLSEDWKSDTLALTEGAEYQLVYYSKGEGADAYIENAGGEKLSFTSKSSENVDGWIKTTAKFMADGDATACLTGGNNTVYFDGVSLKEILKPAKIKITSEGGVTYAEKGESLKLTAVVYDRYDGIMPGETVEYSIKESNIDATVSADGILTVGDDAVLGSYVTVVATAASDDSLKDEIKLLICGVESMPVAVEIAGDASLPTLTNGEYTKKTYTAEVYDQYGDKIEGGAEIKWAVVEKDTTATNVTISENGEVSVSKGAVGGVLVISASATKDGVTAVSNGFAIDVIQSVEGIRFEVGGVSVEMGGERTVKLIFTPENAKNKNFTVTSSDENVFEAVRTIDGVSVTALSKGEAVITATSDDGGFVAELIATTADNAAEGIDTDFENGGNGWNVNKVNLIPNGDFEKNSDWASVGASAGKADSGYVKKDEEPENVYEGEASAYVIYGPGVLSNQWSAFRNTTTATVMPGSLYRLVMALNVPTIENGQRASLSFKITDDVNNTVVAEDSDILRITSATDGWEMKETEYRVGENGTKLSLIAARTYGKAGFGAYFDNLTFETIAGVTNKDAYNGSGSMRVGAYGNLYGTEYQIVSSDAIEIEASSIYNAAAVAKSLDKTAKAGVGIDYLDADKKVIKSVRNDSSFCADWSEISVALTAPENARYLKVLLISDGVGMNCFDSVSVVKEAAYPDSVDIKGADIIAIPENDEKTRNYEPLVLDRFGEVIKDKSASLELVSAPSGVILSGNTLKISKSAASGDVILRAKHDDFVKVMTVKLIKVTSFEIEGLPESVERGVRDSSYDISTVIGIDSNKKVLGLDEVEYSIIDSDEEIYFDGSKLIIKSTASLGEFSVKAVYKADNDVVAQKSVTVKKKSSSQGSSGGGGGGGGGSTGGGVSYIGGTPATPSEVEEPTGTVKMNTPATITDVGEDHWAYQAINTFAKSGIVSGRGDSKFEPEGIITRSEFLKILVSVFGLETSYEIVNFTDTVETAWYYPYVSTAVANNITFGYPDGSFGINKPVTREEMAVFIERAMAVNNTKLKETENASQFPDQEQISPFASEAVLTLKNAGIVSGDENGMFNPKNNATRAEAVWMLYKIYTMK